MFVFLYSHQWKYYCHSLSFSFWMLYLQIQFCFYSHYIRCFRPANHSEKYNYLCRWWAVSVFINIFSSFIWICKFMKLGMIKYIILKESWCLQFTTRKLLIILSITLDPFLYKIKKWYDYVLIKHTSVFIYQHRCNSSSLHWAKSSPVHKLLCSTFMAATKNLHSGVLTDSWWPHS